MSRKLALVMIFVVFMGILTLAFNIQPAKASGTIYIRADGSIEPSDAPVITFDNVTYTLTDNITSSADGIVVQRDNIVIDGARRMLQGTGSGNGIDLSYRSNVTIENITITAFAHGVFLYSSSGNTISGNTITKNEQSHIFVAASSNNTICKNVMSHNATWMGCVRLVGNSSGNVVLRNLMNDSSGVHILLSSSDNIIAENNITNNVIGTYIVSSVGNRFYHNNYENNTLQILDYFNNSTNIWDDGYPSGGNYWSDYSGVDVKNGFNQDEIGGDGIGDTPYNMDANNTDNYPLMAPFNTFDAGTWNGENCHVNLVSSSTVSNFQLNLTQKMISFNVSGIEGAAGFCRITISNLIVENLWQGNFMVLLNGESWPFRNWADTTNAYIYINYTHSEHQIVIIPEFPSFLVLPLFMIATLLSVIVYKRKHIDNDRG